LRAAYIIKCVEVIKDASGAPVELRCTYDPSSKSGTASAQRKVKGTLHWVSASQAFHAEVRLFDHLFREMDPDDVPEGGDWRDNLNPQSLQVLTDCWLEPSLKETAPGEHVQFERLGYFVADSVDSAVGLPVFNRAVPLRDTWAKIQKNA
jgi:glutaminyl-tRNA synthetase